MLVGLRGERGRTDWILEQLQKHPISVAGTHELLRYRYGSVLQHSLPQGQMASRLREYFEVRAVRAGLLRAWLPLIELARMESTERLANLPRPKLELASALSSWSELLISPSPDIYDFLRRESLDRRALYAAACVLAAERVRMARAK